MNDECQWDGCCQDGRPGGRYYYAACLDCDYRWQIWDDLAAIEGMATFHESHHPSHIVHVFYPN